MHLSLIICLLALLAPVQVFGKVALMPLSSLVASSELIVVAQVESVSPLVGRKRYARARVTEVWKGTNTETIEILASPSWICDTSTAVEGETVVLFLNRIDQSQTYAIENSGRGRIPLRAIGSKNYVTVWSGMLPKQTNINSVVLPELRNSVELTAFRDLVMKAQKK